MLPFFQLFLGRGSPLNSSPTKKGCFPFGKGSRLNSTNQKNSDALFPVSRDKRMPVFFPMEIHWAFENQPSAMGIFSVRSHSPASWDLKGSLELLALFALSCRVCHFLGGRPSLKEQGTCVLLCCVCFVSCAVFFVGCLCMCFCWGVSRGSLRHTQLVIVNWLPVGRWFLPVFVGFHAP